jgi:hypothetical protein
MGFILHLLPEHAPRRGLKIEETLFREQMMHGYPKQLFIVTDEVAIGDESLFGLPWEPVDVNPQRVEDHCRAWGHKKPAPALRIHFACQDAEAPLGFCQIDRAILAGVDKRAFSLGR